MKSKKTYSLNIETVVFCPVDFCPKPEKVELIVIAKSKIKALFRYLKHYFPHIKVKKKTNLDDMIIYLKKEHCVIVHSIERVKK